MATEQQDLIPDLDDVTPRVKRAANQYKRASEEKSAALSTFKAKHDNLIEVMIDEECYACPVELGGVRKIIRLEDHHKLKIDTAKQAPEAEADE